MFIIGNVCQKVGGVDKAVTCDHKFGSVHNLTMCDAKAITFITRYLISNHKRCKFHNSVMCDLMTVTLMTNNQ